MFDYQHVFWMSLVFLCKLSVLYGPLCNMSGYFSFFQDYVHWWCVNIGGQHCRLSSSLPWTVCNCWCGMYWFVFMVNKCLLFLSVFRHKKCYARCSSSSDANNRLCLPRHEEVWWPSSTGQTPQSLYCIKHNFAICLFMIYIVLVCLTHYLGVQKVPAFSRNIFQQSGPPGLLSFC